MEHKFKVGDKVVIIGPDGDDLIGKTGEIIFIDSTDIPYRLRLDSGETCFKYEHNIKLDAQGGKATKNLLADEIMYELNKIDFHGHPDFYRLLVKIADLHSRKNHDYAGKGNPLRNFYKCKEQGLTPFQGVMVRLSDKRSRLESFCRQGVLEVKGESVVDTLMDNAVYSLLAILLFEEEKNNN